MLEWVDGGDWICIDWIGLIGLDRLYGMDIVCEVCQFDRDRKAVIVLSDWIHVGNLDWME